LHREGRSLDRNTYKLVSFVFRLRDFIEEDDKFWSIEKEGYELALKDHDNLWHSIYV
jgi:hypothetical protein